jgi:penicillin-binding protein 1A
MAKFVKTIFLLIFLGAFIGSISILGIFVYFGKDLPDYTQLANYDPPVVTRIHAADGKLFGEYATERRVFIPIQSIPSHIIRTFLAAEDRNFYSHVGLDWMGLLRATIHNITSHLSGRKSTMGGSTITQQVAKNFLLTNEKTLTRKIKEAILSFRIERTFSKDKILELYLNEIYLGGGAYGVAAAALHYFNKSLDELTVAEAAYLAALPKAPNNYHPLRHPEAATARRNWVIARMLEEGIITKEEALGAKKQPITLKQRNKTEVVEASYFAEEVRRQLLNVYGDKILYEGGLSVRTTLDSRLQKIADAALRHGLIDYDQRHGWHGTITNIPIENWKENLSKINPPKGSKPWQLAVALRLDPDRIIIGIQDGTKGEISFESMKWARKYIRNSDGPSSLGPVLKAPQDILKLGDVVLVQKELPSNPRSHTYMLEQMPIIEGALVAMDPHTGRVLAVSGGFSYERSEYNRATQAYRQAGSSFKTFVYLTALENGYTPASILLDAPFVFDMGGGRGLWKPQNIQRGKFFGLNTIRTCLERSFNLSVIRLAHTIGMKKIAETAKRFDIYDNLSLYLATVLGSQETTLLRLTTAYGMLVNGGKKIHPVFIDRIQDRQGKTLFKNDQRVCTECGVQPWSNQAAPELVDDRLQVVDPISAYQLVSILESTTKNGTGRKAAVPGQIVGGKSGTSNDQKDTWFLGFSSDLVVGVFVGFDNPQDLGRFQTGGSIAAPIFGDFMKQALAGKPSMPFRIPSNAKFVMINSKTGEKAKAGDPNVLLEVFKPGEGPVIASPVVTESISMPPPSQASSPSSQVPASPLLESSQLDGIY